MANRANMSNHPLPPCVARLFVVGDALNSRIARDNLKRIRERLGDREFHVEIIDVMENPQAALDAGVYVTPALEILAPAPGGFIYGNLSDDQALQGLLF